MLGKQLLTLALGCAAALAIVVAPSAQGPALASRVTLITDSVGGVLFWATGPREELGRRLDLRLETKTCRKLVDPGCPAYGDDAPESALATIKRLGPELGPTVVVDVGYNDRAESYAEALDEVMHALVAANVVNVVWVTLEETEPAWAKSNAVIRSAPARWPQLTVADWAPAVIGQPWLVDGAHLNYVGAVAFASFLRPIVLKACGDACAPPPPRFCGLARGAGRFVAVEIVGQLDCDDARAAAARVAAGVSADWKCTPPETPGQSVVCSRGDDDLRVLDRAPVRPVRTGAVVTLANWTFRLRRETLIARGGGGRWLTLGRAPFCVPSAPREVLVELGLRPVPRQAGCFTLRR